jgi:predicted nucleic acid-binding Zn ribbon protein
LCAASGKLRVKEFLSLNKMNKCRHCGTYVPSEKAFCPNCSEPIEPEEAPNRAASSSTDMMATMRDDPEHYKELLLSLKKKKSAEAVAETSEASPASAPAPFVGYSVPQSTSDPRPPAPGNKRNLVFIIGGVAFLILLFVILLAFKLI